MVTWSKKNIQKVDSEYISLLILVCFPLNIFDGAWLSTIKTLKKDKSVTSFQPWFKSKLPSRI